MASKSTRRRILSDRVRLSTISEVRATIKEYLPHLKLSTPMYSQYLGGSIRIEWPKKGLVVRHYSKDVLGGIGHRGIVWAVSTGIDGDCGPKTHMAESLVTAFFGAIDLCKKDPLFYIDISKLDIPQEDWLCDTTQE